VDMSFDADLQQLRKVCSTRLKYSSDCDITLDTASSSYIVNNRAAKGRLPYRFTGSVQANIVSTAYNPMLNYAALSYTDVPIRWLGCGRLHIICIDGSIRLLLPPRVGVHTG
jgi:hypothetical protein